MPFFTKEEIKARMKTLQQEKGPVIANADLNLALIILGSALFENKLKSGEDYGLHPLVVGMSDTRSNTKKIIGFLHDVVEDSDWTLDDLREIGFAERIVDGVNAMTRRAKEGELYFDFVERCSLNSDAVDKKIEDLSHNMDMSRNEQFITAQDTDRTNKYVIARAYLVAIKKEQISAGSSIVDFISSRDDLNTPVAQTLLQQHSKYVSAAPLVTAFKQACVL